MAYQVIELEEPGNDFQDELNLMEKDGWTLVHIIQGFATVGEELPDGERQRVFWKPRFIFHKEETGMRLSLAEIQRESEERMRP